MRVQPSPVYSCVASRGSIQTATLLRGTATSSSVTPRREADCTMSGASGSPAVSCSSEMICNRKRGSWSHQIDYARDVDTPFLGTSRERHCFVAWCRAEVIDDSQDQKIGIPELKMRCWEEGVTSFSSVADQFYVSEGRKGIFCDFRKSSGNQQQWSESPFFEIRFPDVLI